ncbi:hypothetical protein BJ912DRAFT_941742 [Pholiota molesta]|nr:hypothetical protein BJ912DRAFT_941742 [Pholiota molesta]
MAREMPGVGQGVGGEAGVWVSRLRGMAPRPGFVDRQFSRLVLKDYGACHIGRFVGHRDLLCGFRDAIAGHQRLWNAGILHGDVNMENILLTSQHAPAEWRSVLIDLDLAMWVKSRPDHPAPQFHNQGTRAYMSLNVLESHHTPHAAGFARDYLDDLESFYYLLRHICASFTGPGAGQRLPEKPEFVAAWEQPDAGAAALAKMGSLLCADADSEPTAYFGGPDGIFGDLLEKLRAFVARAAGRKRTRARAPGWGALRGAAEWDYGVVLRLVDDALCELRMGRWMVVEDTEVEEAWRKRVREVAEGLPLPAGVVGAGAAWSLGGLAAGGGPDAGGGPPGEASGCRCGRKRRREEEGGKEESAPQPKRLKVYPPVALGMLF